MITKTSACRELRDIWDDGGAFVFYACIFLCVVGLGLARIIKQCEWISKEAKIEQLRDDAAKVHGKMAEDVAGQVAALNQEIKEHQRWRKTVFFFMIPSGWDRVGLIEMPVVDEKGKEL